MSWIKPLLRDERFKSDLEREYTVKFLRRRELALAQQHLYASLLWCFAGSTIFAAAFGWRSATAWEAYAVHAVFFLWLVAITYWRGGELRLKHHLFAVNTLCDAYWLAMLLRVDVNSPGGKVLTALVIIQGFCSLALLPYRNWIHGGVLAGYVAAFVAAAYLVTIDPVIVALACGIYFVASNAQILMHRNRRNALIADFRDKSRYIPLQVIRRSLETNAPLAAIYPQEQRYCVCMSSDWRGFQNTARHKSPQEIGEMLAAYYAQVSELLAAHFPAGNYFYDWIADELFCVIFSQGTAADGALVRDSVAFAAALLAARPDFDARYGAPHGIDVGLTAGLAVVGVFGPTGQGKATAFGEIPGRSRRIQTLGKELRRSHGDADRVIFDDAVASQLNETVQVTRITVTHPVRDLDGSEFFFVATGIREVAAA